MHLFNRITIAARKSPLSKVQVTEVYQALKVLHPTIEFINVYLDSTGDLDHNTSLRTQEKTDFFTREIDNYLLRGKCNAAIHSAKDLPEQLPKGLCVAAITACVDPKDVLVMRKGKTLETLDAGSIIGTSSVRREEALAALRSDFRFLDIRGNIQERLAKLDNGEIDALVVAEAALIRLGLTDLNRVALDCETSKFQGQLAILTRSSDLTMRELFAGINVEEESSLPGS